MRHKPYFRLIEPGLHLGYRRLPAGPGTWVARRYLDAGKYTVQNLQAAGGRLIVADDYADANGVDVLTFAQAQEAARGKAATIVGSFTVAAAVARYLKAKTDEGRNIASSLAKAKAWLGGVEEAVWTLECEKARKAGKPVPTKPETARKADWVEEFGALECERLTRELIRSWRAGIASTVINAKKPTRPEDAQRRRNATANRVTTLLKAALNFCCHEEKKISTDQAWRKLKPIVGTEFARKVDFDHPKVQRLVNACSGDFRKLVQGGLLTGARYGQLIRARVADFNAAAKTLFAKSAKGSSGETKTYHIILDSESVAFFKALCAGRGCDALIFTNGGAPWKEGEQIRLMNQACKNAGLVGLDAIPFHGTRHIWASLAIMSGTSLFIVAQNFGHADTKQVEKVYGHLAKSFVKDAVEAGAPKFGFKLDSRVVPLHV